jgi:hypothetical protein
MNDEMRSLEWVMKPESIKALIERHLIGKVIFLKGYEPHPRIRLLSLNPNGTAEIQSPVTFELEDHPVFFRILGRYLELHATIIQKKDAGHFTMRVDRLGVSLKDRSDLRIPVEGDEVCITNIQTSKYLIDTANARIPTTVKVSFGEYQLFLANEFDFVKIDVFEQRGTLLDEVRKTGKAVFVSDTTIPESYSPPDSRFLDYASYLGANLQKQIFEYRKMKVRSEVIWPVIYVTHDRTEVPIGYIQLQSRTQTFDLSIVDRLKQICEEMIEKIRLANTVYVKERESIINLSISGMRLRIRNRELSSYLMRQSGFTFDVLFRGQAPITVYGLIRSATKTAEGHLICGVQIAGYTDDTAGRARYESNVRAMEQRYREKLQMEMKKQ